MINTGSEVGAVTPFFIQVKRANPTQELYWVGQRGVPRGVSSTTFSRQPAVSYAASLISAHMVHLACLDSFSIILLHVVLGRLTLLFPSGCHSIATMQSSFLTFLSTWPIQFHILLWISSLIFFKPVTWEIVSFRMHCGNQIHRIPLRAREWAKIRVGFTRLMCSLVILRGILACITRLNVHCKELKDLEF